VTELGQKCSQIIPRDDFVANVCYFLLVHFQFIVESDLTPKVDPANFGPLKRADDLYVEMGSTGRSRLKSKESANH
jgi:hypothetical protein